MIRSPLRAAIFSIVAPSGAGKNTALRLLAFLEPPDRGMLRFEDFPLNGTAVPPQASRHIAMVFQRPLLLHTSVRENIALGLRMLRARHRIADRAGDREIRSARSRGRERAHALWRRNPTRRARPRARAQSDVLLLDEPTANLDPFNVGLIDKIVKELHTERDATIVLVTHNVLSAAAGNPRPVFARRLLD